MLNRTRVVLNSLRVFENNLLDNIKTQTVQQKRTTFVFKRKNEVNLYKKSGKPFNEKLKHRHFIYDIVETPESKKHKSLDVILLDYVEGFGERGDRMTLKHSIAYNKLILPGLATYASPENIAKFADLNKEDRRAKFSTPFVERTMNVLSTLLVHVVMNIENPWTVEKWHVRTALRRSGIYCPEEAITMPEKKISGPDLDIEGKEFYITVTINKQETVKVRCRIHHYHSNPALQLPRVQDFFKLASTPIFPEDKEVLDSMPRHRQFKEDFLPSENKSEPVV